MTCIFQEYFRCATDAAHFELKSDLSGRAGYFQFGPGITCYGRLASGYLAKQPDAELYDSSGDVVQNGVGVRLPFDPSEVVNNFYYERYMNGSRIPTGMQRMIRDAYYFVRPSLPLPIRKHLQKFHLNGWRKLTFPHWPVDTTVDQLMEQLMTLAVQRQGGEIPFIWFWPDGKDACAVITHDVETQRGVELSNWLMDVNESYGIPASFQVIPEQRYTVSESYLESIRRRGFEVNVQDLNHDGNLYRDRRNFEARVSKINAYGKHYGAAGFRAGVLYRNQEWFDLLDFEYDTSVPNVAHLDPQHGGCCTVMPYFVGHLVELPVTTTQDYSLFHIMNDYSLALWKQQFNIILSRHGLINVITHPDYITDSVKQWTYTQLIELVDQIRRERNVWVALPRDVSTWWRQRSQMRLVRNGGCWQVEGLGSERAVVAYAQLGDNGLQYRLPGPSLTDECLADLVKRTA